ncbi:hypothetical protein Ahy_B10g101427 [Arachis hypogaea]|uniref:Uncharacterized protein n=1 Tax=Arachis hypogaea TaxID=3818 RepID=A0A444WZK8_ARAHY|nr:hypothetical protein Ahy_B10g101427 [Arachis hypogaea]
MEIVGVCFSFLCDSDTTFIDKRWKNSESFHSSTKQLSLYLLSGGKTIYFGQASEAYGTNLQIFFAQAGFPCPALRNLSDHFLRCINSDFDKVKSTLKGFMKLKFEGSDDPLDKITTAEAIRTLIDYYRTSQHSYAVIQKVNEISKVKGTELNAGGSQASFFMQSYTLTKLSFINMSRDFVYYWLRLVIYIVKTRQSSLEASKSFIIAVKGSPSQGRRRRVTEQQSQSRTLEQHSNVQPVQPPSKTPVAEPPNNQSLSCKNPKQNRMMSSSEPTSNEVPNERTPEVGGENVESVVRSSMDSGALTKPPPHPRSKKRKVDSTNMGATSGATPTNPAPSNVDTGEEDGKDKANEVAI